MKGYSLATRVKMIPSGGISKYNSQTLTTSKETVPVAVVDVASLWPLGTHCMCSAYTHLVRVCSGAPVE